MILTGHYFRLNSNNAIWRPTHTAGQETRGNNGPVTERVSLQPQALGQLWSTVLFAQMETQRQISSVANGHVLKCGLRVHCLHVLTEWNIIQPLYLG